MSLAASSDCFAFLDARLRSAVEAAVAGGADPHDALRGLYISDEQALRLAADGRDAPAPATLSFAAERLGLDRIDAVVLAMCAWAGVIAIASPGNEGRVQVS